jgi:hypothetical protein
MSTPESVSRSTVPVVRPGQVKTEFPNLISRILLQDAFQNQFLAPIPAPKPLAWTLKAIERLFLRPDLSGIRIDRPIFLIGLPRSGTTMLQDLLAAHERVAYLTNSMHQFPESLYGIEWLRRKLGLNVKGERYLGDSIEVESGSAAEPALLWSDWAGRDYHSLIWPTLRGSDMPVERVARMHRQIKTILYAFQRLSGAEGHRIFFKYPGFSTEVTLLQDLFPDAQFIHIVRDGRYVANSMVKLCRLCRQQLEKIRHPTIREIIPYPRVAKLPEYVARYGAEDLRTTAHVWSDTLDYIDSVKGGLRSYYEIRYEDLLLDPQRKLLEIFEFCGLPPASRENERFWRKLAGVGIVHHENRYGGFETVESLAGDNLRKHGYL